MFACLCLCWLLFGFVVFGLLFVVIACVLVVWLLFITGGLLVCCVVCVCAVCFVCLLRCGLFSLVLFCFVFVVFAFV